MTAPILMPCPAALLRPGLRDADGSIVVTVDARGPSRWVAFTPYYPILLVRADLGEEAHARCLAWWRGDCLDLRDPSVRDALVREIWRKLRPGEPEPITAPLFWGGRGGHGIRYRLSADFGLEYCWRAKATPGRSADAILPVLADLADLFHDYEPLEGDPDVIDVCAICGKLSTEERHDIADRDLLALRAIALAVLA